MILQDQNFLRHLCVILISWLVPVVFFRVEKGFIRKRAAKGLPALDFVPAHYVSILYGSCACLVTVVWAIALLSGNIILWKWAH